MTASAIRTCCSHGAVSRAASLLFVSLMLIGIFSTGARAQCPDGSAPASFYLESGFTLGNGCTVVLEPVVTIINIVAGAHVPITKARFSIQDPPFGDIIATSWIYIATGDLATGVEITLPGCTMGPNTVLGSITVLVTSPAAVTGSCAAWMIEANPEIDDCNGVTWTAESRPQEFSIDSQCCTYPEPCFFAPPYDLSPADGATAVQLNPVLSWSGGFASNSVRFGTDPTCSGNTTFPVPGNTFAPGTLMPMTTYYWQVFSDNGICYTRSPVQSFTTAAPIPIENRTWGAIKAMYG